MALLKATDSEQERKKPEEGNKKYFVLWKCVGVSLLLDIPQPAFYLYETPNLLSIIWEAMTHVPGIGRLGFNSSLAIMSVSVCESVCTSACCKTQQHRTSASGGHSPLCAITRTPNRHSDQSKSWRHFWTTERSQARNGLLIIPTRLKSRICFEHFIAVWDTTVLNVVTILRQCPERTF